MAKITWNFFVLNKGFGEKKLPLIKIVIKKKTIFHKRMTLLIKIVVREM